MSGYFRPIEIAGYALLGGMETQQAASPATVTGISATPSAVTLAGGATQQLSVTVAGTNSPSQAVNWSGAGAAYLNSSTANPATFTAPAATYSLQTIQATATSQADPSFSATVTVTINALVQPHTAPPNFVSSIHSRARHRGRR